MLRRFEIDDLWAIAIQPRQERTLAFMKETYGESTFPNSTWTLIKPDSEDIIACFGYSELEATRSFCWSILSHDAGPYLTRILRAMRQKLEEGKYERYELLVHGFWDQGFRFAEALGFTCETPNGMARFHDGETCYLYSKV